METIIRLKENPNQDIIHIDCFPMYMRGDRELCMVNYDDEIEEIYSIDDLVGEVRWKIE